MPKRKIIEVMDKKIELFGLEVSALNRLDTAKKILDFALMGKHKFVTYLNAHCINISFVDQEYKEIIKNVDLLYTGGLGVIWASRILGNSLPERVNIFDFFDYLVNELRSKEITFYLLGNKPEIIKNAEGVLRKKGLKVLGSRNGFFNKDEEVEIIKEINSLEPDILMVGMGVPEQEKWIQEHISELNINLCWAVGAAFEWISGYRKRPPAWMIRLGLAWLHRLCQQPKRLWKRYLIGNMIFIYRVLKWRIKHGKA